MAYVPPALRGKQETKAEKSEITVSDRDSLDSSFPPARNGPSVTDIQNHFWPPPNSAASVPEESRSSTYAHSTLNSSQIWPNELVYILLFKDANPQWETNALIYVKTNLHLLQGLTGSSTLDKAEGDPSSKDSTEISSDTQSGTPSCETDLVMVGQPVSTPRPIMLFQQDQRGIFSFLGYFRITRLDILDPHSDDLARMLKQKWTIVNRYGRQVQKKRDESAWKASMSYRWAVMELKKDEKATETLEPPVIAVAEKQKTDKTPQKSVNDMLKEMRLEGKGS